MTPQQDTEPVGITGEGLIAYYWQVLKKRKWVVFTFAFCLVLSVTVATTLSTPIFAATAVVQISPKADQVLDVAEVSEFVTARSSSELRNYYATQYKVMQSRTVVGKTIAKLRDEHAITAFDDADDPIKTFRRMLTIQPVVETHLVNVRIEYPDPELAILFADTLAHTYIQHNLEAALQSTEDAYTWLQEQERKSALKKRESDQKVHEYRMSNDLVGVSERFNATEERMRTLQLAWSEASAARIQLEAAYSELSSLASRRNFAPLAQHLGAENTVLQDLLSQHDRLMQEKSSLEGRAGDKHPDMVRVNNELQAVEARILTQVDDVVAGKRAELKVAQRREAALGDELAALKTEMMALDGKLIELEILETDAARDAQFYRTISERLAEVGLSTLMENNNITLVDPAVSTDAPVSPNLPVNVAMGLLLGVFGGCALAFVLDLLDTTIKSKEDVEQVIGVPLLGVVPGVPQVELQALPDDVSRYLFIHARPRSTVAECLRSIRTNVLFRLPKKPTRTLLITSAAPREGKSFTSSNLAASIAMTGNRVLLIDADLRRPALHQRFGLDNEVGLANLFSEGLSLDQLKRATHISNLEVIVAGPPPPNPGELLSGGELQAALADLDGYDFIIIDTPPVNVVADPLVLASEADGVLLVVEADRTSRAMVRQAGQRLFETDAPVLGAVVNKLDLRTSGYSYSYYDSYGYYYTEAEAGGAA